jgi:hypothetical protein
VRLPGNISDGHEAHNMANVITNQSGIGTKLSAKVDEFRKPNVFA